MTTNSTLARRSQTDRQNRWIFGGAIGLAILAAVLAFTALSSFGGSGDGGNTEFAGVVDVVVASRSLSAGTTISGDMLEIASLPQQGVIDGAYIDADDIIGSKLRVQLERGEQFSPAKVGQSEDGSTNSLTYVVPPGKRALAIDIAENTGVGGLVVAGDRVDLIVVIETHSTDGTQLPTRGEVLLQDVEVLAVAQRTLQPTTRLDTDGNPIETDSATGSIAERPDNADSQPDASTVTLAVDPEDAPLVALAQTEGTIFLALRPFGDDEQPQLGPRTIGN